MIPMNDIMRLATRGFTLMVIMFMVQASSAAKASANGNDSLPLVNEKTICVDGMILSAWRPLDGICGAETFLRGLVYFLALVYLFVGVSIVSDRFMASIEMITSLEKEVKVKKKNGQKQIVIVRVWNATVANLTLMALGSSAPEILLSIIETMGKGFEAGELGPGTIVGSAAFNLFVIIGICIVVIPDGQVRKIKHLRVFFTTAFWSVFAYLWLYFILAVTSPGRVETWEAVLTFLFFPLTVGTAYMAERRLAVYKYLDKNYRINRRGIVVQSEGIDAHLELKEKDDRYRALEENGDLATEDMKDFDEARKDYMNTIKELRKTYPHQNLETLEVMAMEKVIERGYKSRAFYRVQATRKILRRGDLIRKMQKRAQNELKADLLTVDVHIDSNKESKGEIYFDPAHYTVMESCGHVMIRVIRRGNLSEQVFVDYETMDGSAESSSDYIAKKGTLSFPPGIDERRFRVQIIDDEVFQPDQHFYVRLSNVVGAASLATPFNATVMILDDDHSGIFSFGATDYKFVESVDTFPLSVHRYLGARGRVKIPYWTEDGTAKDGKEYEGQKGELIFENNETEIWNIQKLLSSVTIQEDEDNEWHILAKTLNYVPYMNSMGLRLIE